MTVKLALVGTGLIARFHVAALHGSQGKIVSIYDTDPQAGSALAHQLDAAFVSDYAALLADSRVQGVVIATPNDTHFALAMAAVEAGKDVFCEKPMTTSPQESAELVKAVQQRPQQIFQVGYMKRYNPGFRLVKETLPQLGDLLSAHIRVVVGANPPKPGQPTTWHNDPVRSGGGVLYHSGSHLMDVTRMLFGDPLRVDARITPDPRDGRRDLSTMTLIDMQDGPPVYFSTILTLIPKIGHTQQGWEETVEIIGSLGRVTLSSPNWEGTLPCIVTVQIGQESQTRTIFPPTDSQWALEFVAFVESLQTRRQQQPDVVDGYKVDEVLATIVQSAAEKCPVPIRWRI
jgi:predicted dehydrogenase